MLAKDGQKYGAFCPELDLVTEMGTPEDAIEDLIEAFRDYADEFSNELELFLKSCVSIRFVQESMKHGVKQTPTSNSKIYISYLETIDKL